MNSPARLTFLGLMIYAVLSLGSMATMSIGVAVFLILTLLDQGGPTRFWRDLRALLQIPVARALAIAAFAYALVCILSLVLARFLPLQFAGKGPTVHLFRDALKTWYLFVPLFLALAWRRLSEDQSARVLRAWLLSFGLISCLAPIQLFTGWPRSQPNPLLTGYFHTTLLLGHHLSVASVWIFPFFAGLDLFSSERSRKQLKIGMGWFALFLFMGAFALFFTYSRTLWVALPLGVGLWGFLKLPRRLALGGIAALIVAGLGLTQVPSIRTRLLDNGGLTERKELWRVNAEFIRARPWLGVGFGKNLELSKYYFEEKFGAEAKNKFVGHAHNIYIEILSGTGALGLLAWIAWAGAVFWAIRLASHNPSALSFTHGILCAWLVLLINGFTQVNFWESKVLHTVVWTSGIFLAAAAGVQASNGRSDT